MTEEVLRCGLANEGGFFSPYCLFDLLARRHEDELDLPGRDLNRPAVMRSFGADGDRPYHVVFFTAAGANITTITGAVRALGSGCGAGRSGACAGREGRGKGEQVSSGAGDILRRGVESTATTRYGNSTCTSSPPVKSRT